LGRRRRGALVGQSGFGQRRFGGRSAIIALIGLQYWQQQPSVEEIEEIDAALLTSDLPINAYLDKSFDTWLKRSQH
jgi:hypothetical protein